MSVRTKKTVDARRREAVAYHEAGHAVVAHMLGYKVLRISIAPKAGSDPWRLCPTSGVCGGQRSCRQV
jgi:hypothetical protein